jgi:hypothetical protein
MQGALQSSDILTKADDLPPQWTQITWYMTGKILSLCQEQDGGLDRKTEIPAMHQHSIQRLKSHHQRDEFAPTINPDEGA